MSNLYPEKIFMIHNTQKTINSICLAILLSNISAYSMTLDLLEEKQIVAKLTEVISCHDPIKHRNAEYLDDFFAQNPSIRGALCILAERDVHITTPLHAALKTQSNAMDMTVLKLLCKIPREYIQFVVNQQDESGRSALQIAAMEGGDGDDVYQLLCDGADVQHKDELGNTALHYAARQGNEIIIQWLVKRGASVNQFNKEGQTPLCLAALAYNVETFCTLLKFGADASEINQDCINVIQSSYQKERCKLRKFHPYKGSESLKSLNKYYKIFQMLPRSLAFRKESVATILAYTSHARLGEDSPFALLPYYMLKELTCLATSTQQRLNP
jgi:hypothetical protein